MEADAALGRSAHEAVLDAEALEYLDAAVVHVHGARHLEHTPRVPACPMPHSMQQAVKTEPPCSIGGERRCPSYNLGAF